MNNVKIGRESKSLNYFLKKMKSDSVGFITDIISPALISEKLEQFGKVDQRERELPNIFVVVASIIEMMMGLSKRQVLPFLLFQELMLKRIEGALDKIPSHTAFIGKQKKIGFQVFKALLKELVSSDFVGNLTKDCRYKGLRLVAADGTKENVADTEKNNKDFGRLREHFAYPQMWNFLLLDISARLPLDVEVSPTKKGSPGEVTLSHEIIMNSVEQGMLLLLDRGLPSCDVIDFIGMKGAYLLARVSKKWKLKPVEVFEDGSYTAFVRNKYGRNTKKVRVIEYEINTDDEIVTARLITTLLDFEKFPADELVKLYSLRWEIEISFNEIDNQMLEKRINHKSKNPDAILLEVYCIYLAYFVIRIIMLNPFKILGLPASRLSFIFCLRMIRMFFPALNFMRNTENIETMAMCYIKFFNLLGYVQNDSSKKRRCKRVVKNRNVKFQTKKPREKINLPPVSTNVIIPHLLNFS